MQKRKEKQIYNSTLADKRSRNDVSSVHHELHRCAPDIKFETRCFVLIAEILANVNSRSRSLYVVVRPSVCRLSVCNVRAPYSGDCIFRNILRHLERRPSVDIQVEFYGDRPRRTPPSGELNTRGVAKYSDF